MHRIATLLCYFCSQLALAQTIYTVADFDPVYYAKIAIDKPDQVFSSGWVGIYQHNTHQQIIQVKSAELALNLHDGKALANRQILPYGEQSLVLYKDFNFDGKKDFAIQDGQNSCYHGPSFQIYLATAHGFSLNRDFTALAQKYCGMFEVDAQAKILSTTLKSGCCWHQFSEFRVEHNQPKAMRIISEKVEYPYILIDEQRRHGNKMLKTSRKIFDAQYMDGIDIILAFNIPQNGKRIIVFSRANTSLDYVVINKKGSVEWNYPAQPDPHRPDFNLLLGTASNSLSFTNQDSSYRIYDQANAVGVEIKHAGKVYRWIGDPQSRSGSLDQLKLSKLMNVRYPQSRAH